jgi:hypothetical protein
MFRKKDVVVITLTTAAAALLVGTQGARTGPNGQANKLEGAWISKVENSPVQASILMTPSDPSGHTATMAGVIQVQIPGQVLFPSQFGSVEESGDFVGEMVMTGPNTANYTIVGYGRKKLNPPTPFMQQVVLIWMDSGQTTFTGPGKSQSTHNVAYYFPTADVDGDGLPDPGQVPVACLSATSLDTRVGVRPPCTP